MQTPQLYIMWLNRMIKCPFGKNIHSLSWKTEPIPLIRLRIFFYLTIQYADDTQIQSCLYAGRVSRWSDFDNIVNWNKSRGKTFIAWSEGRPARQQKLPAEDKCKLIGGSFTGNPLNLVIMRTSNNIQSLLTHETLLSDDLFTFPGTTSWMGQNPTCSSILFCKEWRHCGIKCEESH